jgi:hypothetical protein
MNRKPLRRPAQVLALCLLASPCTRSCAQSTAPQENGTLKYSVSWLGNSFPGNPHWVQQDIAAMHVAADGTVYTNVEWEEGGRNVGVYKDGAAVGDARHTHGWGYNGGRAVAANAKYVFIAQSMNNEGGGLKDPATWPPKGFGWIGISRRLRSDITKGAPFEGGKGGSGDTIPRAFLPVAQIPDDSKLAIRGLWATPTQLFVSDPHDKTLKIYNAETMALEKSWPLPESGPLLMDRAGTLWILDNGAGGASTSYNAQTSAAAPAPQSRIVRYTVDGRRLPQQIVFSKGVESLAFCLDPRGRLLVADGGASQQIHIYDSIHVAPKYLQSLGIKGGIYAGRAGAFGDWKLNRPVAVGCDAAGNVYVAHGGQSGGGGTVLESYAPNKKLNWRLLGLQFVDMADADPADVQDIFTKEERFRADYSRPRGREAAYAAFTFHPRRFPDDPRKHIWSAGAWVRRIGGKRFLFVNDMNAEYLQVYRFEASSEIAIPCGLFAPRGIEGKNGWPAHQPAGGEWTWADANGNGAFDAGEYQTGGDNAPRGQGWWVDSAGSVWRASEQEGMYMFPLRGVSAQGVPSWDLAKPREFEHPKEFETVKRLRYDAASDVMYLGGTTAEHKNQHWKPMGPVIARYDGWLRGARALRWKITAPYQKGSSGHQSSEPMGFDVAGDLLFVPYTGASKELKFSTGHIEVFRASDGKPVGSMEPSPDIGEIGLQDIRECLTVRRRADGEYLVFLEEDYKAKILMYRVRYNAAP